MFLMMPLAYWLVFYIQPQELLFHLCVCRSSGTPVGSLKPVRSVGDHIVACGISPAGGNLSTIRIRRWKEKRIQRQLEPKKWDEHATSLGLHFQPSGVWLIWRPPLTEPPPAPLTLTPSAWRASRKIRGHINSQRGSPFKVGGWCLMNRTASEQGKQGGKAGLNFDDKKAFCATVTTRIYI